MIRRRGLLLAVIALGCGVGEAAVAPGVTRHEILMRSNSFAPRELSAQLGDTILWKNADVVRHNAVRPETFETGDLRRGESFAWVPSDTGTYSYRCTIHPRMRGLLRVTRVE